MSNQENEKEYFAKTLLNKLQNLKEFTPFDLHWNSEADNDIGIWSIQDQSSDPGDENHKCTKKGTFDDLWSEFLGKKADFKKNIGIDITRVDDLNGFKKIEIRPSHYVGITAIQDLNIGNKKEPVYVIVKPKITNANFLTMLNYAYNLKLDLKDKALLEKKEVDFLAIFFLFFLKQLKNFIKHLRRNYIIRQEFLSGKIKGKIMLKRYLQESLPRFQNHIVPCQFFDLTQNCLANRILKYTLYLTQILYRRFSKSAQSILYPHFGSIFPYFSLISYTRILLSDFKRIRYLGQFKAYVQIHKLCKLIIQNTQIAESTGETPFKGFVFNMNDLFEKFIAGILKNKWKEEFVAKKTELQYNYEILFDGKNKKPQKQIELDGLFIIKKVKYVFDSKYKEVFDTETPISDDFISLQGRKIKNSDVFQVIAYSNHNEIAAREAILVYPSGNQANSENIRTQNFAVPVNFVAIDITSKDLDSSIKDFIKHIQGILS